ncbi:RNA-directed DNA polymerase, eukaryota, Reverse transcriptase zinc-binding domain protein [Artemisia annua]|uniref:RNA-directed DNA polymerase, eukaryota, Reverse transcriptase zinc-binding domain protein n=1 Tax=Artemisia annua TaxID=35608 RepID=A0A2U1NKJ6_ARTAN|nr:RNA-directed DNA polymerase, eukaryota, Reverse transcriptase zinc-binding domain protein [Artemisia annua]
MDQMGFPPRWCLWIRGIIQSARSAVLVNGSPTFEFYCQKGLRQGDPLSPFLFLIVMEALTNMILRACRLGDVEGIKVSDEGPSISHMLYADDALIMGTWSRNNIVMNTRLLRIFFMCSGLKINVHKSHLFGLGVSDTEVSSMAEVLGYKVGSLPFQYLGIKVGANMNRSSHWDPVVETVRNRLQSWKAKVLSIGGRLTLIKSVLSSLPVYYLSLFKAPGVVLENIERMMNKFLWTGSREGRGIHWVSWDIVTRPKRFGGLGISKLSEVNLALLVKWMCWFKTDHEGWWRKFIISLHGGRNRWAFLPVKKALAGNWKSVVNFLEKTRINGESIDKFFTCQLGDGSRINFWKDIWYGTTPLCIRWPILYSKDRNKKVSVKERIRFDGTVLVLDDSWELDASTVEGISEVQDVSYMLSQVKYSGCTDRWIWDQNPNADFSVAAVKNSLRRYIYTQQAHQMIWVKWVPIKVNILMWRIEKGRVPTRLELVKRRMVLPDSRCPLCRLEEESVNHLFITCEFSFAVWSLIWRWCKLIPVHFDSITDLVQGQELLLASARGKELFRGITMVTCWAIWKERNEMVFQNSTPKVVEVVSRVKSMSFLWFNSRAYSLKVVWKEWVKYPMYML